MVAEGGGSPWAGGRGEADAADDLSQGVSLPTIRRVGDSNPLGALSPTSQAGADETSRILSPAPFDSGDVSKEEGDLAWPVAAWYVLAVELCERLAYYGASVVFFPYMKTMLGFNQDASNALYNCFNFWCYASCLIGGYVSDAYLGRVDSIVRFAVIYAVGLIVLTLSAAPFTWSNYPDDPADGFALPGFGIAILFIGLGTGGIKANVSPLMADQIENRPPEVYASVFRWFYWAINVGSFVGMLVSPILHDQVGEKRPSDREDPNSDLDGTGYWASFVMPLGLFIVAVIIFMVGRHRGLYVSHPPSGSILSSCFRAARFAWRERSIAEAHAEFAGDPRPSKRHWLDWASGSEYAEAAGDLKLALRACTVFLWYPVYWVCYGQTSTNLVAQADLLERPSWIASEALNVVGAATVIVLIPVFEKGVFPMLRRAGYDPSPLVRISIGFILAAIAILYAATLEYYIHERGSFTSSGDYIPDGEKITIWWQIPPYFIIALSEIFASVGGLEFAYTQAPDSMKSLVMSVFLCTDAAGSLLGLAISPAMIPQNMVYVFFSLGGTMAVISVVFFFTFRGRATRTKLPEHRRSAIYSEGPV